MIQSVGQTRLVSGEQEKPQYAIATDWGTDTDKEMGGAHSHPKATLLCCSSYFFVVVVVGECLKIPCPCFVTSILYKIFPLSLLCFLSSQGHRLTCSFSSGHR